MVRSLQRHRFYIELIAVFYGKRVKYKFRVLESYKHFRVKPVATYSNKQALKG